MVQEPYRLEVDIAAGEKNGGTSWSPAFVQWRLTCCIKLCDASRVFGMNAGSRLGRTEGGLWLFSLDRLTWTSQQRCTRQDAIRTSWGLT